jgi:iron complex outermembrane receptor protein
MTSTRYLTSISLAALALGAPALAFAQDTADAADTAKDIVVTGTRVAGRTKLDSTAPVDVFSGASLQQQATPQLDRLPAPVQHRRHRCHPPGHAARHVARPDAGAGQWRARAYLGAGQSERLGGSRFAGG